MNNVTPKLDKLMLTIAISPAYKGYDYIKDAIILWPKYKHSGITALNRQLASMYDTNPHNVERCIRHAKDVCIRNSSLPILQEIFGNNVSYNVNLTNKSFIALLSNYYEREKNNG